MDQVEQRRDVLIREFKEKLVKAAHEHWVIEHTKKTKADHIHTPEECPARMRAQDPPFCPCCNPWLRPWERLDFKTIEEIWDYYSTVFNVALTEYTKLL